MKDIEVEVLEGGSFLVRWKSMEDKEPECAFYDIFVQNTKTGKNIPVARIKAEKKKDYSYIVHAETTFAWEHHDAIITVKAVKSRNKPTKTEAVAVLHQY